MSRPVVFARDARRQIQALHEYIAARSGSLRADRYVEAILARCRALGSFPQQGTRRDEIRPGLRTLGFRGRVTITFVVEPTMVVILGVFYGGQDYPAAFRRTRS